MSSTAFSRPATTAPPDPGYTNLQRAIIIISCMLGFALDLYDVLILPFLLPAIQRSLALTLTEIASVTSLTLIGSVIGGAVFGWIGDRMGRRTALQLTLGLFALGSIASAFSWNYASLAGLRLLTGIGLGGEWGAGMVLFNEAWNPKRRGLGSAFIQGSAAVASASASIIGIWAVRHFGPDIGWRIGILTGGAPIVLMIAIRFLMPESRAWLAFDAQRKAGMLPPSRAGQSPLLGIFAPGLRRITITALLWMSAYMFAYYAVIVFVPTLMLRSLGTPPDVVRSAALVVSVTSSAGYIMMGALNDRFGRRIGALLPSLMWLAFLVGLAVWGGDGYEGSLGRWPLFWLYIAFGLGNTSLGVVGTWLSELYPIAVRSTAVSVIYMAGRAVGSIAPIVVPQVAAAYGGSLARGMLIALPAAVLFLILTCLLPETAGRRRGPNARIGA
jgi:SHS family lactate transporter-like MFS transporter